MRTRTSGLVTSRILESIELQRRLLESGQDEAIARVAQLILRSLRAGGKLILFGNGGSAADAQHIAAELVGQFMEERPGLPAIALSAESSTVTSIANDFGFEAVFARQLRALCRSEDVVLGLSTSGRSPNVLHGLAEARDLGATTIGLTGASGGTMDALCDECIHVPSDQTPRIQEGHTLIAHIVCEIVDREMARDA